MTKQVFLSSLEEKLQGLPKQDIDERLSFYSEMIDDRIDEGKSEEEAVDELGDIDKIVEEIAKETSLVKLVTHKIKPKRKLRVWEIILIAVGFPLWFPLLITAFVLALVAYLLIWILVIVCYVTEISLVVTSIGSSIAFALLLAQGNMQMIYIAVSILAAGGAILFAFACYGSTKATLKLSKTIITKIKTLFIRKGEK